MDTFIVVFGVPILALLWFVVALTRFLKTPRESDKRRARKIEAIISSVVAGVLLLGAVSLVVMMFMVMAHM